MDRWRDILLRKILWKMGYVLRARELDALSTCADDPREIPYLEELPYTIQNLPLENGVGLRYYPFCERTYHPFVLALQKSMSDPNSSDFVYKILKKYNELFSLKNANDFLGLSDGEECFPLESRPYQFTYPWSTISPASFEEIISANIIEENRRYGLNSDCSLERPYASEYKIQIEKKRLVSLLTKVKSTGFHNRFHDSLGCFVLLKNESWRWYVHGGQHRAAVLVALGYKTIPVRVRQIIRREDVCLWPNVQSGLFTKRQALLVFDKLFRAEPPPITRAWIDYVDQTFYADNSIPYRR